MTETFYDRLGVSPDATTEEIETAYREAIKRVHPDVSDDVDAGERTKRLNKAKRVLTDEDERDRYDRLGHAGYTGTASSDGSGATATGSGGTADGNSHGSSRSGHRDATGRTTSADDAAGTTTSQGGAARGSGGSTSRTAGDSASERSRRDTGEQTRRTGPRHEGFDGGSTRRESGWSDPGDQTRRTGRRHPPPGEGASRREKSASRREANDEGRRERRADGVGTGGHRTDSTRAGTWNETNWTSEQGGTTGANHRRRRRRSADGTTRSRGDSTGPSWQSNDVGASTESPSAKRQAAAGATDGPNLDWSWNSWESTGAWAVRQSADRGRRLRLSRLFPKDQSMVLLGSIFFLYPFFVGTMLYPGFPISARFIVAVCTLLTFAYLLSIPEAAIAIYGLWSVLVPLAILAFPAVSLFSLVGVIGLTATWVPLGLSVLTFSLLRP